MAEEQKPDVIRCPLEGCGYFTGICGDPYGARLSLVAHLMRKKHGATLDEARKLAGVVKKGHRSGPQGRPTPDFGPTQSS